MVVIAGSVYIIGEYLYRLNITSKRFHFQNAGSSIRPQLPDLVIHMLESLSGLEDQRLNYAEVLSY